MPITLVNLLAHKTLVSISRCELCDSDSVVSTDWSYHLKSLSEV